MHLIHANVHVSIRTRPKDPLSMQFSLGQAARQVTVSKTTLLRAIRSGKLSATKVDNGYSIEASELFRVFEPAAPTAGPGGAGPRFDMDQAPSSLDPVAMLAVKDAEIAALQALLIAEKERREEMKEERDSWREQAQRALLTHYAPPAAHPIATTSNLQPGRPGLLVRLRSALLGE